MPIESDNIEDNSIDKGFGKGKKARTADKGETMHSQDKIHNQDEEELNFARGFTQEVEKHIQQPGLSWPSNAIIERFKCLELSVVRAHDNGRCCLAWALKTRCSKIDKIQ